MVTRDAPGPQAPTATHSCASQADALLLCVLEEVSGVYRALGERSHQQINEHVLHGVEPQAAEAASGAGSMDCCMRIAEVRGSV